MKLSKEELEFALVCAKSYYYESSESDYPNKSDKDNEARYRDLENAIYADKLEIEGYEQVKWIKFNRNDPSTYPPVGHHIIVYSPGHMSVLFRYSLATETDEQFADRFTQRYGFTHWHKLPEPPQQETK